mmetsp:Transcript_4214/g.5555  ORF Transcript_4214/g.5555 Transcript_4214/m.5555 type:complete len:203 (-) Transcript_4214:56-664(-)
MLVFLPEQKKRQDVFLVPQLKMLMLLARWICLKMMTITHRVVGIKGAVVQIERMTGQETVAEDVVNRERGVMMVEMAVKEEEEGQLVEVLEVALVAVVVVVADHINVVKVVIIMRALILARVEIVEEVAVEEREIEATAVEVDLVMPKKAGVGVEDSLVREEAESNIEVEVVVVKEERVLLIIELVLPYLVAVVVLEVTMII